MRFCRTVLSALLVCAGAFAQAPQKGVEAADIDRKADPCNDFFQYANGAWRAANPIPASMQRWSRRWASGELAKDQLKEILDDVSKKTDWPKGSIEQQIGDYYGACMNEKRLNEMGMKPIQPMLAEIDAIQTQADLQKLIGKLHDVEVQAPFFLFASSDNHNPTQVIADISAAGLDMPDREYYLKPDERFKDAREKYRVHVANLFKLAGYSETDAKSAADTVFQFETKLAENSLDNVAFAEPGSDRSQNDVCRSAEDDAAFRLERVL